MGKTTKKAKEELNKKVEGRYEITMYKLLGIFAISLLVMLGAGMYFGNMLGFSKGVDAIDIETPSYCHAEVDGSNANIVCNEVDGLTADELCERVSPTLQENMKIVIITSNAETAS